MIKKIVLKQPENPADQVPVEVLATSIKGISDGIAKLRAGPLNEKALILLIQHAAPYIGYGKNVTAKQIKAVLDGMESLEREYLKPKKSPRPE